MLVAIIGSLRTTVLAQCSIASFSIHSDCGSVDLMVLVDLQGGALPYQLTFTSANGQVVETERLEHGMTTVWLYHFPQVLEPPLNLVVTDAQGCTTTASGWFTMHAVAEPSVWLETPCGGAEGHLHFSGNFTLAGSPGMGNPCGGSLAYRVTRLSNWWEVTGLFDSDWTEVAPGIWRFNTALAPSSYEVHLYSAWAPGGCESGMYWCFSPAYIEVPPSPSACGSLFTMSAALGGALHSGTLMEDHLRANGLVPTTEPYSALGYAYVGGPANLSVPSTRLLVTGPTAIVDWVVIEIRAAHDPSVIVYSEPALIQRDGVIIDVEGSSLIRVPVPAAPYYVALHHRNHLGVMTASPGWLGRNAGSAWSSNIDFRASSTPVYGNAARMAVGPVQCSWPGDSGGDGIIRYTGGGNDRDPILQAIGGTTPTNTLSGVYTRLDVNLDGEVKYTGADNDRDAILLSVGGTTPTASRVQQLP